MKTDITPYNPLYFFQNNEEIITYLSDAEKDDDRDMIVIAQNHVEQFHKTNMPSKEQVKIRFDTEILEKFRATGKGWQTRMNDALKDWLSHHPDLNCI